MTQVIQPISVWGMALGLVLTGVTIVLLRWAGLRMTKTMLIATLRTFVQLIAIGFVLEVIFEANRWYWVLGMLAVMVGIAAHTTWHRLHPGRRKGLFGSVGFSIVLGAGFTLLWVTQVVIHVQPWYHPQYIIPLAGMIIGNSMNSASIALERFYSELDLRKPEIETLLALGASSSQAAQGAFQAAVSAAMIPNINAMMVVGLVSLPGTMTGQILAGQAPLSAVNYQIVVMLMWTCAAAISTVAVTYFACKKSFNTAEQLISES